MRKKRKLPLIALALVVLLVFQLYSPVAYADPGSEVSSLLENMEVVVTQNDEVLDDGDDIDITKEIKIKYSFDIPVIGDESTSNGYVAGGDYATFTLPDKLTLVNSDTKDLKDDESNTVIGQVEFVANEAKVTFDTIIDDETISDVSAWFEAEMSYVSSSTSGDAIDEGIYILGKTFKVVVPVTISGEKKGTPVITNKVVDWKVKVTAELEGVGEGKLEGYSFSDNLSGVGTYVTDSFKVGKSDDVSVADLILLGYDDTNKTLSYTFPNGAKGTYYLFFQTGIPDDMFYTTTPQNITNTATISKDGEGTETLEGTASFTMEWIAKSGKVINEYNADGSYNYTGRQIEWKIQANQKRATLNDAKIIDTLPVGLTFDSATIAYRDKGDADFGAPESIVPEEVGGQTRTFNLVSPLSGKECLIILVTNVDDTTQSSTYTNFTNSAELTFDGLLPSKELKSTATLGGNGIGVNPITKTAGSYNNSTHTMHWSVKVDTKGQTYGGGLRVLDLLVYGDSDSFIKSDFLTLDTGNTLTDVKYADLDKLTPRFNQKYNENFTTTDGLGVTVHHLVKGGKNVADILVVTQSNGTGFDYTKSNSFSYDTLVTNPDIYASNATTTISNTATAFSGADKLNSATASRSVTSEMLKKDLMTRENAAHFEENTGNLTAINSDASGDEDAFDYKNKSVIYRIHVNKNGLVDATKDVTTEDGVKLDNIKMTDTLPKGWEFKQIDGKDFLIFEKTVSPLQATGSEILNYSTFLSISGITAATAEAGQSMSFEFSQLTKPYVILVKAGPMADTAEDYFSKNGDYELTNKVKMGYLDKNFEVSAKTTIISRLLSKDYVGNIPADGTLLWTVNYKPYNIAHGDARIEDARIEDVLPIGLDLRLDSHGNLAFKDNNNEDNIKIVKLDMATDGTYTEIIGDDVTEQDYITYDNATRTLRFNLPNTDQAYRLTYKTDVNGTLGTTMENTVKLIAKKYTEIITNNNYKITAADAGATFSRGGLIKITKIDQDRKPLPGAEFTLFTEDGTIEIKKGITGADGFLQLKAITPGEYTLKETKVPADYNQPTQTYTVSVVNNGGKITTRINDTESNMITVWNTKTGTVGDLKIKKTVTGNAGDRTKEFVFTVNFDGTGTKEFPYTKTNSPDGMIKSGDIITLTHDQEITIKYIPKGTKYTVTENNYAPEGYTTVKSDDTGVIKEDDTQTASFINSKKKKDSDVVPGTKGSVEIIKVDEDDSSKTLAGA
ncbi:MAG: SpaA isopeptide-forming pilin-related protein, partial [Anaerotignum sp.]|nr:SpaA isopeptide-forming pilin-related protein [Anaerotignum sp.]